MNTVNLTCNVRFQNMEPFQGFIRASLNVPISEVVDDADNTLIAQLKPQEKRFDLATSSVTLELVPNEFLKGYTYYKVEIWRSIQKSAISVQNTMLFEYPVIVPNYDCNLEDLAVIEPVTIEGINIGDLCKTYAGQAKESAIAAEESAVEAKESATVAEQHATSVEQSATQIEGLVSQIGDMAEQVSSLVDQTNSLVSQTEELVSQSNANLEQTQSNLQQSNSLVSQTEGLVEQSTANVQQTQEMLDALTNNVSNYVSVYEGGLNG